MSIVSGTVIYGDAIKHAGYDDPQFAPSKRAEVHLTFEGDILDEVAAVAVAKVHELLGSKPPKAAVAKVAARTKADIEREAGLKPGADAHVRPQPLKKPAVTVDPDVADLDDLVETDQVPMKEPEPDGLDDLLGSSEPEVTDEELLSKITHTNGRTKNSVAIRKLVDQFVPGTDRKYQAREIAQDRRADFLKALEAVPKLVTAGA